MGFNNFKSFPESEKLHVVVSGMAKALGEAKNPTSYCITGQTFYPSPTRIPKTRVIDVKFKVTLGGGFQWILISMNLVVDEGFTTRMLYSIAFE